MQPGIVPLAAIAATGVPTQSDVTAQGPAASGSFEKLLQRGIGELNTEVAAAETALGDLAAGKSVQLHEVMISLERAQVSVQTFLQVRNKVIESYQDLMRLQL